MLTFRKFVTVMFFKLCAGLVSFEVKMKTRVFENVPQKLSKWCFVLETYPYKI